MSSDWSEVHQQQSFHVRHELTDEEKAEDPSESLQTLPTVGSTSNLAEMAFGDAKPATSPLHDTQEETWPGGFKQQALQRSQTNYDADGNYWMQPAPKRSATFHDLYVPTPQQHQPAPQVQDDWIEYRDADGNRYFYNQRTGESRWTHPSDEMAVSTRAPLPRRADVTAVAETVAAEELARLRNDLQRGLAERDTALERLKLSEVRMEREREQLRNECRKQLAVQKKHYERKLREVKDQMRVQVAELVGQIDLPASTKGTKLRAQVADLVGQITLSERCETVLADIDGFLNRCQQEAEDKARGRPAPEDSAINLVYESALELAESCGNKKSGKELGLRAAQRRSADLAHKLRGFLLKRMELEASDAYRNRVDNSGLLPRVRLFTEQHNRLLPLAPLLEGLLKLQPEIQQVMYDGYTDPMARAYTTMFSAFFKFIRSIVFRSHWCPTLAELNASRIGKGDLEKGKARVEARAALQTPPGKAPVRSIYRHMFQQLVQGAQAEQKFIGRFFGVQSDHKELLSLLECVLGISSSSAGGTGSGGADIVRNMCELISTTGREEMHVIRVLGEVEDMIGIHQDSGEYVLSMLTSAQRALKLICNEFIREQVQWAEGQRFPMKKAGVLYPLARLPGLVDRIVCVAGGSAEEWVTMNCQHLITSLMQWMNKRSTSDPHFDVVHLENCFFLWQTLKQRKLSFLDTTLEKLEKAYDRAKQRYLMWIAHGQFGKLLDFFTKVEKLIETTAPTDVSLVVTLKQFQNATAVKNRLTQKGVEKMFLRMDKHLGGEANMLPVLWDEMRRMFQSLYGRYVEMAEECFDQSLLPPQEVVSKMFQEYAGRSSSKLELEGEKEDA